MPLLGIVKHKMTQPRALRVARGARPGLEGPSPWSWRDVRPQIHRHKLREMADIGGDNDTVSTIVVQAAYGRRPLPALPLASR